MMRKLRDENSPSIPAPLPPERKSAPEENEMGFDPRWLIDAFSRHYGIGFLIFISVFSLGIAVSFLEKPKYSSQVKIKIEEKRQVFNEEEFMNFDNVTFEFYRTQIQMVKSRQLIRQVIQDIGIELENDLSSTESRFPFSKAQPSLASRDANRDATETAIFSKSGMPLSTLIDNYIKRLTVTPDAQSPQIIFLSFVAKNPELAAKTINMHGQKYIELSRNANSNFTDKYISGLEKQLESLNTEIKENENKILEFKKEKGFFQLQGVSSYDPVQDIDDRLSRIRSQLAQASEELKKSETTYKSLFRDEKVGNFLYINQEILTSPALLTLQEQQTKLRQEWMEVKGKYLENHPRYQKVKNQLNEADLLIQEEKYNLMERAKNDYEKVKTRHDTLLNDEQNLIREKYQRDAEWSILQDLNRNKEQLIEKKTSVVKDHQNAKGSLETQRKTDNRTFEVVDPGEIPLNPSNIHRLRSLILSFIAALFAMFTAIVLIEFSDHTIRSVEQLEQITGISVMGSIPSFLPGDCQNVPGRVNFLKSSAATEAFIALRTRLLFSDMISGIQTLSVTSALPEEGKSILIVNLASSLAIMGKRTIIVDCDLRKPKLHTFFGEYYKPGICDIISKSEIVDDVLIETDIPNLYFIPAGELTDAPSELLTAMAFREILEQLKREFHYIFIDSPPVLFSSDASIIALHIDGTLLVVRHGKAEEEDVVQAIENITQVGGHISALVLNGIPQRERKNYAPYGNTVFEKKTGQAVS